MLNLLNSYESKEIIHVIKENLFSYDKPIHTELDTRKALYDTLGQHLKNYWSGQTHNMHMIDLVSYKYITINFIDQDIIQANQFTLIDEKKFVNIDHNDLALTVINRLCDAYFITPNVYIPHQANSSNFSKFFKRFKK